jgi:hypothetical protein
MNQNHQSGSAVTLPNPTTTFRQEVANFLFSCDQKLSSSSRSCDSSLTSWIGDTARSISLRAIGPAGDVNPTLDASNDDHDGRISSTNQAEYVCMTCGTLLLPQTNSTNTNHTAASLADLATLKLSSTAQCKISLRSMKRGRSRRRRASRCRAKELHNASLLMKRVGSTNNAQVRMDAKRRKEVLKLADSYRIGDGKSAHCIVIQCKCCGSKVKRKGIDVKVKYARRKTEKSDVIRLNSSNNNNKNSVQTQKAGAVERKTVASQIRDNTDFISLASFGSANQTKRTTNNTPLLQTGKKKKKKKQEPKKKSDLMDFLSSLND